MVVVVFVVASLFYGWSLLVVVCFLCFLCLAQGSCLVAVVRLWLLLGYVLVGFVLLMVIGSFCCLFVCLFVRLFVCSFVRSFVRSS